MSKRYLKPTGITVEISIIVFKFTRLKPVKHETNYIISKGE
jgi:hypothetical protein